jgi:hypothetical protein
MSRLTRSILFAALLAAIAATSHAQTPKSSPTPATSPRPTASPAPTVTPAPTPVPSPTPSAEDIINSMAAPDLQQAIQLLKSNYINPDALNDTELNRALLSGILLRLGTGVQILPDRAAEASDASSPFFAEVLDGHAGYLRLGALNAANLKAMDSDLQTFISKKVDALVIDLRASPETNDFAVAADFAKRFTLKGKLLFTLRKSAVKPERSFTAEGDPVFQGLMIVLADGDTAGPAEAIAGVLRLYNKALVVGAPTAGRAVEYSDLPLNGGRVLRVAVAEAVLPEGRPLFPGGIKPDIPVEMAPEEKRLVFHDSLQKGMSQFVFESERPHLNEAALLAGRNPEIEALEAAQRRGRNAERSGPRDPVVQRAIDVVTSVAIYQQK